ncbi:MAG: hypothetical protein KF716_22725 [Anaerolineae bacterium]|nr:hypothetical protein [Anaerolineae bacterium]
MFKRLLILILIACLSLLLTSTPTIAQGDPSRQMGAYLSTSYWDGCTLHCRPYVFLLLNGTKTINITPQGRTKTSVFDIDSYLGLNGGPYIRATGVQVGEDADQLAVSQDLGWAGLDFVGSLVGTDRLSYQVVLHVSWWATGSTIFENGLYKRAARVEGYFQYGDIVRQIPFTGVKAADAYIFSTQAPR